MSIALAIGHITAEALVKRLQSGRHKLVDGVALASAAEARAVVQGASTLEPLIAWARENRNQHGGALALWLLLERYDRRRSTAMIASAVDSLVRGRHVVSDSVSHALSVVERREASRLDAMVVHTPHGKATVATAIARAYRAVGGLRDEH